MKWRPFLKPLKILFGALMCVANSYALAGTPPAFTYTQVMPGVDYLHYTDADHPWSVHVARIDRKHQELELVASHAAGRIAALATLEAQIAALPAQAGRPVAGVNADFFVIAKGLYQGDPMGLQIINGELSSAADGATFWTEAGGKYFIRPVTSQLNILFPRGTRHAFGLNEQRGPGGMALYTPAFSSSTRATNGLEYVLESVPGHAWLPFSAGKNYSARVREVGAAPNTPLSPDTLVLSIAPELAGQFTLHPGEVLKISTASNPDVSHALQAVGGKPILVEHGRLKPPPVEKGTNAPMRNPRTAIGFNDRYFYFMVVDGRQKDLSVGMTFAETGKFMQQLGCTEALNLDGGGSTTFWLDGKVLNSPSDKHERPIANAIILVKHPSP